MPSTETPVSRTAAKPAHRDSNVLRWLVAYAASVVGDSSFFLALGWAANQIAGPAEVGVVMAVGAVPRAVFMLGGGVIADRLGPRRVVVSSDAVRCLVILAAAAALTLASPGLWLLIAVALIFGVVDAVFMPAMGALPPRLTGSDQLLRVQGMRALAIRLGNTTGPPLAGLAMAFSGPAAAFTTTGGLFALSLVLLLTVRIAALPAEQNDPAAGPGVWRELVDGLRYVRRQRLIGVLVMASALVELGSVGPLNVGLVLLADERNWGPSGAGWVIGAFSVGAGVSALLLALTSRMPRPGLVQIITLTVGSAGIASFGLASSLPVAAGIGALAGLMLGLSGGLTYALVQAATEPSYFGRVMSLFSLASFGLGPLTYPVFGAAVGVGGTGPVFAGFGAVCFLGAVGCMFSSAVRRAELPT